MTAPPVTDPTSERPPDDQSDARHTTPIAGDGRWPGPSRDELLGQRARHRSTGELDDRAISIGGDDVGVPEVPVLEKAGGSEGGPAWHFELQVNDDVAIDVLKDVSRLESIDFDNIGSNRASRLGEYS